MPQLKLMVKVRSNLSRPATADSIAVDGSGDRGLAARTTMARAAPTARATVVARAGKGAATTAVAAIAVKTNTPMTRVVSLGVATTGAAINGTTIAKATSARKRRQPRRGC